MTGVALITGASRGIGAATARHAAAKGIDVVVNYVRNAVAAEVVVGDCRAAGVQAIAVPADVAVEADVKRMFDIAAAELGQPSILVNNAGILHPQARLDTYPYGRLREVFDVNVIGAFLCAREAVQRMSTRHGGLGGSIVNVSSAASYLGSPDEFIDYAASKGAIDTLTIGLAKEVGGEGIRVNAVRPGLIDTEIHASTGEPGRAARLSADVPMRRVGTAEEVAATIMWLASDAAAYVNGAIVNCSGGR
ncbi:MAG TPA: SDR family oxidoreductase [Ilumatobacteraceae bacterium]|nr:SDR family oxidoreductase [Ilumatobacteraceae bacterium]